MKPRSFPMMEHSSQSHLIVCRHGLAACGRTVRRSKALFLSEGKLGGRQATTGGRGTGGLRRNTERRSRSPTPRWRRTTTSFSTAAGRCSSRRLRSSNCRRTRRRTITWASYRSYGLIEGDLTTGQAVIPPVRFGERAFEIVLARRIVDGSVESRWFE